MSSSTVPDRSDVETEYQWDLEGIFASDEEWEAAYADVEERLDRGLTNVETAMDTLEGIVEGVEETVLGIEEVSHATDEQAASSEEIAAMVDEAARRAEEVSNETEGIAGAAEQQSSKVGDIEVALRRLNEAG